MLPITSEMRKLFKGFNYSAEVILLSIYLKCRYSLSYRDIEEMGNIRGLETDHATLQRWVVRFMPVFEKNFRKRKKPINGSWRMDETYVKCNGKWVYLYRAVDKYGYTIDFLLRKKRDAQAAKCFLRKAMKQHGIPAKVNVDKSGANKAALDAMNETCSQEIEVRQNKYLNNIVESDHRFIKKRIKLMLGFKSFRSAAKTLAGIELIHMIKKGQLIDGERYTSAFSQFASLVA